MSPFRLLFCALLFVVGAGASFVIPFVREGASDSAALVFGLYFGGMVGAELLVFRFDAIRAWRFGVPATAAAYFASFLLMAFVPAPAGFVLGRALEGVAVGARMPLLFRDAMTAEAKARDAMVAAMNSLYALGYVSGPFLADFALRGVSARATLVAFGALSLVLSVAMEVARPGRVGLSDEPTGERPTNDRFTFLFVAKFFYGFLLTTIASSQRPRLFSDDVAVVFFVLAIVFSVGQAAGARLVKLAPLDVLGLYLSTALALLCFALGVWPGSLTLLAAALVQAPLFFVGFRAIGSKPSDARAYALFAALSDPGSMLGALAGSLGTRGAFVIATVALAPAAIRAVSAARRASVR